MKMRFPDNFLLEVYYQNVVNALSVAALYEKPLDVLRTELEDLWEDDWRRFRPDYLECLQAGAVITPSIAEKLARIAAIVEADPWEFDYNIATLEMLRADSYWSEISKLARAALSELGETRRAPVVSVPLSYVRIANRLAVLISHVDDCDAAVHQYGEDLRSWSHNRVFHRDHLRALRENRLIDRVGFEAVSEIGALVERVLQRKWSTQDLPQSPEWSRLLDLARLGLKSMQVTLTGEGKWKSPFCDSDVF